MMHDMAHIGSHMTVHRCSLELPGVERPFTRVV
jgi:hypothetical protein